VKSHLMGAVRGTMFTILSRLRGDARTRNSAEPFLGCGRLNRVQVMRRASWQVTGGNRVGRKEGRWVLPDCRAGQS
jgi:hypothetical protein